MIYDSNAEDANEAHQIMTKQPDQLYCPFRLTHSLSGNCLGSGCVAYTETFPRLIGDALKIFWSCSLCKSTFCRVPSKADPKVELAMNPDPWVNRF